MGEQSPLLVTDKENIETREVDAVKGGQVRVQSRTGGYKDVDAALYNRVKTKIMPVFAEMTKDPQGVVYTAGDKNNPMPDFDGTFEEFI